MSKPANKRPQITQEMIDLYDEYTHITLDRRAYLARMTALLGSTAEHVGFRKGVTAGAVRVLVTAGTRLLPSLSSARFESAWSGLRPATPDGLPVLGPASLQGLFFAAGHFRNGILLAPATARRMADLIVGGRGADALAPFSADRFLATPSLL